MNPIKLAKAFADETLRAGLTIVLRPVIGAVFDLARAGDEALFVEPDPPRNPGARSAPQSAQEGQQ